MTTIAVTPAAETTIAVTPAAETTIAVTTPDEDRARGGASPRRGPEPTWPCRTPS
ncbi:hypothetical protein [Streptomyces sp. NPDC088358]|uniref:hypothetical protein n=1 Tax=Streptomyces sp. NPDC088358 TaxID=3365857 RepID=UPI0037F1A9C8